MYPYLLRWPFEIPSYFAMMTLGFMVGIYIAFKDAPREKIPQIAILDLSIVVLITSIIGAKLLHVIADGHLMDYVNMCIDPFAVESAALALPGGCKTDLMCDRAGLGNICNLKNGMCYQKDCFAAIEIWRSGFVFYGGLIGATLGILVFLKKRKLPILKVLDLLAPTAAIGLAIGRSGCFFAGCCFGVQTDSFLGVSFPKGSPAYREQFKTVPDQVAHLGHSLPVIPTQLFSVALSAGIFLYLFLYLRKRRKYVGQILVHFLILYPVGRFLIEFLRADQRGHILIFSTSQLISILLFMSAMILSIFLKKHHKKISTEPHEKQEAQE